VSVPGNDNSRPYIAPETFKEPQESYRIGITMYQLLDSLMNSREVDLYYYLLNEVSIVNFSIELIEISSANNKSYNARIENIISDLAGKKVKMIISNKAGLSLKEKLIADFNQSKTWANLTSTFPECEILDIIHKNGA
jgi:hypothetical protein